MREACVPTGAGANTTLCLFFGSCRRVSPSAPRAGRLRNHHGCDSECSARRPGHSFRLSRFTRPLPPAPSHLPRSSVQAFFCVCGRSCRLVVVMFGVGAIDSFRRVLPHSLFLAARLRLFVCLFEPLRVCRIVMCVGTCLQVRISHEPAW